MGIMLVDETFLLFGWLVRLVMFFMLKMEKASHEASEGGAQSVGIQIMVQIVHASELPDRVGGQSNADGGVEACAQFVG